MNNLVPIIIISFLMLSGLVIIQCTSTKQQEQISTLTQALSTAENEFSKVTAPRPFKFPQDHGPHPDYSTEWWYVTGNINSAHGDQFGYQVTFFRVGMDNSLTSRQSGWASNQFYMAHVALSDLNNKRFYSKERLSRNALGLAGAQSTPQVKVWLENWVMSGSEEGLFPLKITIPTNDYYLDLNLTKQKEMVLQGNNGYSQKGPEPGNASYYYAYTRLTTQGTIKIGEKEYKVSGDSWLDREWSTSVLPKGIAGWDWFSIQLDNQTEIMFYRMRSFSGEGSEYSKGSIINQDSSKIDLNYNQVQLSPTRWWQSPESNIRYPIAWHLSVPGENTSLNVEATIPNQELNHSVRYWEGAIKVSGLYRGQPIQGKGYLELAGYE